MDVLIRFVNETATGTDRGIWLISSAAITYIGMAVSAAIYQRYIDRLRIMVRGALIGLVHDQAMKLPGKEVESEAVTLMSSDVDSVESVGEIFHDTWAYILEVVIGTMLLTARLQWFAFLPLAIIFACSRMSAYVAKHFEPRQKNWNTATQERISTTTSVLGGIKSLKMMGMVDVTQCRIWQLREKELRLSERLRWILVAYNASANSLGIFAPVLTLVFYALSSGTGELHANDVFTSIALLSMVTHPANMVMTLVPRAVSIIANFARIEAYISRLPVLDPRHNDGKEGLSLVSLEYVSVRHPSTPDPPILRDVSFRLSKGELIVCTGAVGSGKTSLVMALLGELPSTGSISLASKKIAYCAQAPWLPSVTIRDAIISHSNFDQEWYKLVLDACCLSPDLESFRNGDSTFIENNGMNLSGGQRQRVALARAVYSRYDVVILDDPLSALDENVAEQISDRLLGPRGLFREMNAGVLLISNATKLFPMANRLLVLQGSEARLQDPSTVQQGKIPGSLVHYAASDQTTQPSELYDTKAPGHNQRIDNAAEDLSRNAGDIALYGYYFNAVGYQNAFLMTVCTATYSFCLTFSQYVLRWATEASSGELNGYMGLYVGISFIAWAATSGTMWFTQMKVAIRSGTVLHSQLLERVLRAPLSYFADTQIGITLNRFSQDIALVDKQLPSALANLSTQIFKLLMQVALIVYVQPVMLATIPPCYILVYLIQKVYLRNSRQLRFLDLESRSRLNTNFLDTTSGVTTIRTFGWQDKFATKNIKALDMSQKPYYLLLCLQCWLKVVLDCIMATVAVGLITLTVVYRSSTGSDIGMALNLMIGANTTLLRLVQNWTSLETSLSAIARLKDVQECVPSEDGAKGALEPGAQWPSAGELRTENITVSYSQKSEPALRNLSFRVNPGQKLVVMGRTGSGKSTLMLSLLRLLETKHGSISIDDINIAHVPLQILRQRGIIAVPQDGFNIPTAAIRVNLDPYNKCTSDEIVQALRRTRLWDKIAAASTDVDTILNLPMSAILTFSAGQMQLFALCRMLLRVKATAPTKPIIILDEASSSLDRETEAIVGDILCKELEYHTVIMIAHRTEGIMNTLRPGVDAIATMKDGKLRVSIIGTSMD
ncbi:ATP-binding cassette transporter [Aspergillus eucalypticola CBS 122712]|uniref:ATP-binding cassette transporter n=1 Tax=Aspergillus eucalypticola (strain CBS 122712 / IBT 29274) TaxID=1448314 RepID=A0A317VI41_ASPEC|nr:ATP-binding cassette transporter [Aspergillus eucalypticola CBS 122712]PWY72678.1 ATP-binding cassette transporter [Aspergillus eucalypticola CBS 122712]